MKASWVMQVFPWAVLILSLVIGALELLLGFIGGRGLGLTLNDLVIVISLAWLDLRERIS